VRRTSGEQKVIARVDKLHGGAIRGAAIILYFGGAAPFLRSGVSIMARLHWLVLTGTIALTFVAEVRPSAAMVIYPWCVQYGGISSTTKNCGFTSFQQCLATARGNGASCIPNPWYEPYPPPTSYRPPLRR
jgi:hypothetical protein